MQSELMAKRALAAEIMAYSKETIAWALLSLCEGDTALIDLQLLSTDWWRQRQLLADSIRRYGSLPIASLSAKRVRYHQARIASIRGRIEELEAKINAWAMDTKGETG